MSDSTLASSSNSQPVPVTIAEGQTPVPVILPNVPIEVTLPTAPEPTYTTTSKGKETLSPTTTEEQDIVTAGQRKVNLIWEFTQAIIAVLITVAIIYTEVSLIPSHHLSNAFFLIVGFYFSRTNHTAIGGVGSKPAPEPYTGR